MLSKLPNITLKHDELPDWRSEYEPVNGLHVIVDNKTNKPVMAIHADSMATLVMAIPKLLNFLSLFGFNHPCRIPVDQVLSKCNLSLLRKGEENVEPKSDSMAE